MRGVAGEFGRRLAAFDQVGSSAQAVGEASQALQTTLNSDTLPRLAGAIDDLARVSRSLDRVLRGVEQQPQSLVFGRPLALPGPGERGYAPPPVHADPANQNQSR